MNAEKKELLCGKCRKRVSYHIFKRHAKTIIKDIEIEYEEFYGVCDECKTEIFVPGLDDRNEEIIQENQGSPGATAECRAASGAGTQGC